MNEVISYLSHSCAQVYCVVSKSTTTICSLYSTTTTIPKHSFFFEIIKLEGSVWPVQRYKFPTFTPFSTTTKPFETFQTLSLKVTMQSSSPSCPTEN